MTKVEEQKKKILFAEDDPNIGYLTTRHLSKTYDVKLCKDGANVFREFRMFSPDICLLDIMLPVKDGFTLAKEIREIDSDVPILFITAKSQLKDVLKGFETGANDYIKKPFSLEELTARIESFLALSKKDVQKEITVFNIGKYQFDYKQNALTLDEEIKHLSQKESELLKALCDNIQAKLNKSDALKKIWGNDSFYNGRSMDVYISKIRKYLAADKNIEIINLRGIGYKLMVNESLVD